MRIFFVCVSVSVSRVKMKTAFFALQFNSILKIKVRISSNLPTNNAYEWPNEMKPKTDDKILNMKKKIWNEARGERHRKNVFVKWMMNNKTKTRASKPIWMSEWKKKNILWSRWPMRSQKADAFCRLLWYESVSQSASYISCRMSCLLFYNTRNERDGEKTTCFT